MLALALAGALAALPLQAWAAPWTDPVTVSGTFAATVPAPATFTCGGLGVFSVTFY